jgi:RNA polymerase sigma factor (sigma-70 family)
MAARLTPAAGYAKITHIFRRKAFRRLSRSPAWALFLFLNRRPPHPAATRSMFMPDQHLINRLEAASVPCETDRVHTVVTRIVQKGAWQLLSVEELVTLVCRRMASNGAPTEPSAPQSDQQIAYLVYGEYGRCLHAAAQGNAPGASGRAAAVRRRQERAYTELGIYLTKLLRSRGYAPDQVEEAVQDALVRIHSKLGDCREPTAFLHWCWLQLHDALRRDLRRQDGKGEDPEAALRGSAGVGRMDVMDEDGDATADRKDPHAPDPQLRAICAALWRHFLEHIHNLCSGEAQRAAKQFAAVLLKFLGGQTDEEIAEQLGITVANVHVLRARGLKRLKGDEEVVEISRALVAAGCSKLEL